MHSLSYPFDVSALVPAVGCVPFTLTLSSCASTGFGCVFSSMFRPFLLITPFFDVDRDLFCIPFCQRLWYMMKYCWFWVRANLRDMYLLNSPVASHYFAKVLKGNELMYTYFPVCTSRCPCQDFMPWTFCTFIAPCSFACLHLTILVPDFVPAVHVMDVWM